MQDTPQEILIKQFNIINSFPLKDRILTLFDLTELSRNIIKNRIRESNPNFTEPALTAELFRVFYRHDLDAETLETVAQAIYKLNSL